MKVRLQHDPDMKTLFIDKPRNKFVPAYLYYLCQKFISVDKLNIKYVTFTKETRTYLVDELKYKYTWEEVDQVKKGD